MFGLEKLLTLRSDHTAVTHVDYSARVQTVTEDWNPLYYRTDQDVRGKARVPGDYQHIFNVRGEPIVARPKTLTGVSCARTWTTSSWKIFLLEKKDQKPLDKDIDWLKEFELD